MSISATGLGSGLDTKSIIDQLVAAERQPTATRLATQEARATSELTALGRLKSALVTFQSALDSLGDIAKFQKRTASLSDTDHLSVTVSETASPDSYEIEVLSLATAHRLRSDAFAAADTVVGEGQLTISVGADSMMIDITAANSTLAGIRDAINQAEDNPGVRASIITGTGGAYLTLTAAASGAANLIRVDAATPGSPLEALEFGSGTTGNLTQLAAPTDASIEINGIAVTSATNSISGAIEGVTLDLLAAEAGVPVTVDISHDRTAAQDAVAKFVSAYNGVADILGELTAYDASTGTAGALLGDAATRSIKTALREAIGRATGSATEPFRTLAEIGITTESNGNLGLNSVKLGSALDTDFDAVGRLFAAGDEGIATRLESLVGSFLDSDGRIGTRESTLRTRLADITTQRSDLDQRMEAIRHRYQAQFTALDKLLSQLSQTSNFLSRQLASL